MFPLKTNLFFYFKFSRISSTMVVVSSVTTFAYFLLTNFYNFVTLDKNSKYFILRTRSFAVPTYNKRCCSNYFTIMAVKNDSNVVAAARNKFEVPVANSAESSSVIPSILVQQPSIINDLAETESFFLCISKMCSPLNS